MRGYNAGYDAAIAQTDALAATPEPALHPEMLTGIINGYLDAVCGRERNGELATILTDLLARNGYAIARIGAR
jgi:hypothetical protein